MAITTLNTVKQILNIIDTSQDSWISALIPKVESDYEAIRNKPFDTCAKLTITDAATSDGDITITISDVTNDFEYNITVKDGDDTMLIAQRIANYFNSKSIIADGDDVLFIGTGVVLEFDGGTTGVDATVTAMATYYPDSAEFTAIKMINYHLKTSDAMGKASESLGDYSVSYDRGESSADYPKDIVGGIKRYVNTV